MTVGQAEFVSRAQRLLYQLVRNFETCDAMCLAQYRVTASQAYALLSFPADSDVAMSELSQAVGVASSTMTRMVDNLVARGLVDRRHDEEDRRIVRAELTARGRELRASLEDARQAFARAVLGEIDEADRHTILGGLERLGALMARAVETRCCD